VNTAIDDPGQVNYSLQHSEQRIVMLEQQVESYQRMYQLALKHIQIVQQVSAALAIDRAFEITCRELAHYFDVPQAAIAVFDPTRTHLTVVAEYCAPGAPSGLNEQIPVAGNPITQYVLEHHVPMVIVDAQQDERLGPVRDLMRRRGTQSLLIAPILAGDEVLGTLGIDSIIHKEFSETDIVFVQNVTLALSQATHNAKLYADMQRELAERQRAELVIQQQAEILAELSTPLIPVSDRTLVMPLIGSIDTARAQQILEAMLSAVATHSAANIIVDITGLPLIDTHVADTLLRAARAVQLLGAQVIITGIRPEVAQTLVSLGVDLGRIRTFSTLQRGIASTR
jgi:anti-anti-sigma factor